MASIIDSYNEANYSGVDVALDKPYSAGGDYIGYGQTFSVGSSRAKLYSAKFYLSKYGSPTGYAVAKIYNITGTFGTNAVPTGAALAVSDNLDVSTITSQALYEFLFSGTNQIVLSENTKYAVTVEYSSGDLSNQVGGGVDDTTLTHPGNEIENDGSGWIGNNYYDAIFYVYGILPTSQSVSVIASSTAGISSLKDTLQSIATTATGTAGIVSHNQYARSLGVTASGSPSLTPLLSLSIATIANGISALGKAPGKLLSSIGVGNSSINPSFTSGSSAIAFDNVATGYTNSGSTTSWTHTVNSAGIVRVDIAVKGNPSITSVTVGGVAATFLFSNATGGATFDHVYTYYLNNVTAGAKTITVTQSGTSYCYCGSFSYTGIDTTNPIDAYIAQNNSATLSQTATLTTIANAWLTGFSVFNSHTTVAGVGAGTTKRIAGPTGDTAPWYELEDSGAALSAGSNSLVITRSESGIISTNLVSFRAASPTHTTNNLAISAVGSAIANAIKGLAKMVGTTGIGSAALTKGMNTAIAASATGTPSITKGMGKTIGVTTTGNPGVSWLNVIVQSIGVTATSTADLIRGLGKSVAVTASAQVNVQRGLAMVIGVAGSGLAKVSKQMALSIGVLALGETKIGKGFSQLIHTTASGIVTLRKGLAKTISVTASGTANVLLIRGAKVISAVAIGLVDIKREVGKLVASVAIGIGHVSTGDFWKKSDADNGSWTKDNADNGSWTKTDAADTNWGKTPRP